jgi:carbon-monoxide dehydrogenase catalytic subunit
MIKDTSLNQQTETILERQDKYNRKILGILDIGKCPFGLLSVCCYQCMMGPCQICHDGLPIHLKLIHAKKTKGICGDTQDTIIAKNLLSLLIKGTVPSLMHAKYIASLILDASFNVKNKRKFQQIAKKFNIPLDKKEIALKGLNDIENSTISSKMSFISKYFPERVLQDLIKVNIIPNSAASELLSANHLCTIGVSSNLNDFLIQGFRLGLANLGAIIIASELQDMLLFPPQLVAAKLGLEILEEAKVNIILIGHIPLLGDKIIELATSDEMINKAKTYGATGINVFGIGCVGNRLLAQGDISCIGLPSLQEFALSTGLVEVVVADFGCIYPNLQQIARSFHTKFINIQGIKDIDNNKAIEVVDLAIKNFNKRKKPTRLESTKKPITFSAGFSFEECIDILAKLNSNDPLKPLLDWLVSDQIHGFVLLVGCIKLESNHLQIIKELLKRNILILGAGCSIYSCIEAGLLNDNAAVEYAGRELGNILCSLAKVANVEKTLPPIWHFGSIIDFAHILNLIFAISTRLDIRLRDIPIVAIVNELGIERPTSIGFGILSLGIPVHFGLQPHIINSNLITNVLSKKVEDLFEGRIILETEPYQAAKLIIGSIDEKRIGLNI